MTEEPIEFFRHIVRDGPFSFSGNEGECYTDLFVPRTYDSGFPIYNRSDSLVGRSGKGEKHFHGEKHFPHGRFIGSGSPEHSLELGGYKRTDLNKLGLQINLKGIMPSATPHTSTPKNSEMDTALSVETKSQLDKMSARSFHSSDSNDSCNDSDMFYNVYTSRSGFSEGTAFSSISTSTLLPFWLVLLRLSVPVCEPVRHLHNIMYSRLGLLTYFLVSSPIFYSPLFVFHSLCDLLSSI